jgi:hypothetical protein
MAAVATVLLEAAAGRTRVSAAEVVAGEAEVLLWQMRLRPLSRELVLRMPRLPSPMSSPKARPPLLTPLPLVRTSVVVMLVAVGAVLAVGAGAGASGGRHRHSPITSKEASLLSPSLLSPSRAVDTKDAATKDAATRVGAIRGAATKARPQRTGLATLETLRDTKCG